MSSTLFVDAIEPNLSSGVHIAGHVIQVVQGTYSTNTAITSTSYLDTGLTASITPTSTSSKILVLVAQAGHVYSVQTGNRFASMSIVRNSSEVFSVFQGLGTRGGLSTGGDINSSASVFLSYLDSPNTTSSVAYKTQAKISNADSNYTAQIGNSNSVITLMEIAQ